MAEINQRQINDPSSWLLLMKIKMTPSGPYHRCASPRTPPLSCGLVAPLLPFDDSDVVDTTLSLCFSSSPSILSLSISSISAMDSRRSSTNFSRSCSFLAFKIRRGPRPDPPETTMYKVLVFCLSNLNKGVESIYNWLVSMGWFRLAMKITGLRWPRQKSDKKFTISALKSTFSINTINSRSKSMLDPLNVRIRVPDLLIPKTSQLWLDSILAIGVKKKATISLISVGSR